MPSVLEALKNLGGSAKTGGVHRWIAKQVQLSVEDRWRRNVSGGVRFQNQVQWYQQYLFWQSLVGRAGRGIWTLTPDGFKASLGEKDCQNLVPKWTTNSKTQTAQDEGVTIDEVPPTPVLRVGGIQQKASCRLRSWHQRSSHSRRQRRRHCGPSTRCEGKAKPHPDHPRGRSSESRPPADMIEAT